MGSTSALHEGHLEDIWQLFGALEAVLSGVGFLVTFRGVLSVDSLRAAHSLCMHACVTQVTMELASQRDEKHCVAP